jgi:hypothetical protein
VQAGAPPPLPAGPVGEGVALGVAAAVPGPVVAASVPVPVPAAAGDDDVAAAADPDDGAPAAAAPELAALHPAVRTPATTRTAPVSDTLLARVVALIPVASSLTGRKSCPTSIKAAKQPLRRRSGCPGWDDFSRPDATAVTLAAGWPRELPARSLAGRQAAAT